MVRLGWNKVDEYLLKLKLRGPCIFVYRIDKLIKFQVLLLFKLLLVLFQLLLFKLFVSYNFVVVNRVPHSGDDGLGCCTKGRCFMNAVSISNVLSKHCQSSVFHLKINGGSTSKSNTGEVNLCESSGLCTV